jgi:outer membrane protein
MKKLLVSAALAATAFVPSAAAAQAIPPAVLAVADLERVTSQCNACKTASAALRSQVTNLQNRQKALRTPLEAEAKSIQAAIDALKGANPDAALQARVRSFQTKQQSAQTELARGEQTIQRNQAYIQKQVADKLGPIYQQVMQRRGANVLLETGSTLAAANSVDISNDVLAALNTALPRVATIAPATPAQPPQQQPQGR